MRPFVKGDCPKNPDGSSLVFAKHGDAKPHLENNTGHYCHFCEMPLQNVPAVEHIKHQAHHPALICHWENLMFICFYCNSRKTKNKIKTYDYYWPHQHNTLYIFDYEILQVLSEGLPSVSQILNAEQKIKAQKTIELFGLNKKFDSSGGIDRRLKFRLRAISMALECKQEYVAKEIKIEGILRTAESAGFFSIWFSVFSAHPEVKEALVFAFRGTAADCFDAAYNPIPRNPINVNDSI